VKKFLLLILREFRQFGSNPIVFIIFLGGPILYALLLGYVYRDAKLSDLPIAVVDYDNSPLSNKVIDALDDNQYLKVTHIWSYSNNMKDSVMFHKLQAVVTIPDGFEADVQQKRHPEINVELNGANMLPANYAATGIQTVLGVLNAGIEIEGLKKQGVPSEVASTKFESFAVTSTRFFNPSNNYLFFLWPGMLGTIMQQVFLLALALSFAKEYEDNTFRHLISYSRKSLFILTAKATPYWLMGIALWVPLIAGFFPFFKVDYVMHQGTFVLASCLFILSLTFMGVLVSLLFNSQLKATEVLMIVALPSFIISGQTWPSSQMPQLIVWISDIIPLTHFLEAFRKLLLFNANIHEVAHELWSLFYLSLIYFVLAWTALKWKILRNVNAIHEKRVINNIEY
jgi:ABC-2 type transport system permease protein